MKLVRPVFLLLPLCLLLGCSSDEVSNLKKTNLEQAALIKSLNQEIMKLNQELERETSGESASQVGCR